MKIEFPEICGNCRFHLMRSCECRRRAPAITADTGTAIWPLVKSNDWCGDFFRDLKKEQCAMEPVI